MSLRNVIALAAALCVAAFGLVADSVLTSPSSLSYPAVSQGHLSSPHIVSGVTSSEAITFREANAAGLEQKYSILVNGPLGPNDGEPLKIGEGTFTIRTGFQNSGHLIVMGFQQTPVGTRFDRVGSFPFGDDDLRSDMQEAAPADGGTMREYRLPLDLADYGRDVFNLTFYMMDEHFNYLGHDNWRGSIIFPMMIYMPSESANNPGKFPMILEGRAQDKEWVLVHGHENDVPRLLTLSPEKGLQSLGDNLLLSGELHDDPDMRFETAPDLDTLFGIHGWNTVMILWTRHPHFGWAHSPVMKPWDEILKARFALPPCEERAAVNACEGLAE